MSWQILINVTGVFCSALKEQKLHIEKQVMELKLKKYSKEHEIRDHGEKREVHGMLQTGNTGQEEILEEELKLGQQTEEQSISKEKLQQVLLSI
jgi:hypothetical protein